MKALPARFAYILHPPRMRRNLRTPGRHLAFLPEAVEGGPPAIGTLEDRQRFREESEA